MMHSGAHGELLGTEYQEVYVATGDEDPPLYPFLTNVKRLAANPHKVLQYAGLSKTPEKPEGTPFPTDEPKVGAEKDYVPVSYGQKVVITAEMLEDDQYDLARSMSAELGRADRETIEEQGAAPWNNAFDTSFVGFESGTSLISESHQTVKSAETQANRASASVELSQTAVSAEITRMINLKNESGQRMNLRPSMLIVPPDLRDRARELLGSSQKPFTANNELNALVEDDLKYMVYKYLSSTTAWFLTAMRRQHRVCLYVKKWPTFRAWDHPDTLSLFLGSHFRLTNGFDEWRGVAGNPGL